MSERIHPEINPEVKLPHINFSYSPESEKARVLYTVSRKNFYNDNYNNGAFMLPFGEPSEELLKKLGLK